jgi:oxalate decarboxylase/phosphoglucose isomerase-like protein (cupin superfamily)
MALVRQVEVRSLASFKGGAVEFFTPQTSDATMLVQIAAGAQDDLFVHHYQTDQLFVVRGSMVLVILQNREYQYIALSEAQPTIVQIPPGIPHGAINPNGEDCVLVNAVLRHGAPHAKDYKPMRPTRPYDLSQARYALAQSRRSSQAAA